MSLDLAPAGWGFLPGAILGENVEAALPDLPLLSVLKPDQRNAAVVEMLRGNPALQGRVAPRHLRRKYGLPAATASAVLQRARCA